MKRMGQAVSDIHGLYAYAASDEGTFIQSVEELCGSEAARTLMRACGGTRVYIPSDPKPHHAICKVLGVETVRQISKEIGNERYEIPLGADGVRNQKMLTVRRMVEEGRTTTEMARALSCTTRSIRGIKASLRNRKLIK